MKSASRSRSFTRWRGGARQEISGGYKMLDAHTVAFAVGDYDHNLPLVIDPILSYSTYFGGNADDIAWAVAWTQMALFMLPGQTLSPNGHAWRRFRPIMPVAPTSVTRLSPNSADNGTNCLVYCTYLGGSQDDYAYSSGGGQRGRRLSDRFHGLAEFSDEQRALSQDSRAFVFNRNRRPIYNANAFVAELNTNGSQLVYSTYLGGSGNVCQRHR